MAAKTDQGNVRENNEDNFLISQNLAGDEWFSPQDPDMSLTLSDSGCLLAVADGMGGMNAGEEASKTAVETVKELFYSQKLPTEESDVESFMKSAVVEADKRIKEKTKVDRSLEGMGTTLVMSWIIGGVAHIAWCGDSRAYIFHPVTGLEQVSKDHSYVQELVDKKRISRDEAFDHPDSNIITRSLGDPEKAASADYIKYELHKDETLLLCSDGLSGEIRDIEIEAIMKKNADSLKNCSESLIKGALKAGGYDNVTIALCQIIDGLPEIEEKKDESPARKTVENAAERATVAPTPQHKRHWWNNFFKGDEDKD